MEVSNILELHPMATSVIISAEKIRLLNLLTSSLLVQANPSRNQAT